MATKVTIIGGGIEQLRAAADPPAHAVARSLRRLAGVADGHRRGPAGRDAVARRQADRERGQRPARHAARLDQRESLAGADFVIAAISVGGMDAWAERPRDPRPLRHRHARRRLDRAGRDHARVPQRAGARARSPATCAEVAPDAWVFNYTNPAPIEALAMRAAAPQVRSYALCSCTGHPEQPPSGWPTRPASSPTGSRCRRWSAGINHCASIQELRLIDGTDAMPLVREQRDRADREVGARDLRRAALLLVALDGVLPADAAARGALRRHGPGRDDALRHHHPRHGLRAGAGARAWRSWRRPGRRRTPRR